MSVDPRNRAIGVACRIPTPHRIINRNGGDRYSLPFFVNPDFDTVIRPLADSDDAGFEVFEYGKYQVDLWRNTLPLARIP